MTTGFEYLCLGILCMGIIMAIYGLVWLHSIPHQIAEANNHPHKRTIHIACWLSLFTLHAIWPLVYLWAIMPGQALGVKVHAAGDADMRSRIEELERRLAALQTPTAEPAQTVEAPVVTTAATSTKVGA